MSADETLWRLADLAGVERGYWDIRGQRHETTAETARALLQALGLPAGSEQDVAASLDLLADEKWQSVLPPVIVARESESVAVPLCLPTKGGAQTIRWTVRLESGETRTGECDLASLPVEEMDPGESVGRRRLMLPPFPMGYHEFALASGETAVLIAAPARGFLPAGARHWGIAAQLYAAKSAANWGIGDFGDLGSLVDLAAVQGAGAIGLNPLHALFVDQPEQASPYSPNSRLFRNPLYLDIPAIPDVAESAEARALMGAPEMVRALSALRASPLVEYQAVAEIKLAVLQRLYRSFAAHHLLQGTARGEAFLRFKGVAGQALERFAMFQAFTEKFGTHDWTRWPSGCGDCDTQVVSELRNLHGERISFFSYLQWLCEEQLEGAADESRRRGMAIGLYNDLAVSVDAASADHWANRGLFAATLRIGAPPDPFNEGGQEWGVVPLNPRQLRATRYGHFIDLLRANMRHAGALRIDHVMGWQRLFLIPAGAPARDGAYVRYPLDDLLAIATLESRRNRCLLIGEDLGTVPEGFRERMADANVLSCRVFYFEREHERFRRPSEYPALASVSAATHDLPTLRGFWEGDDIAAKSRLGSKGQDELADARAARGIEKRLLLEALASEGLLPDALQSRNADLVEWTPDLSQALQLFLARTPSALFMIQLDDLAGEARQINLPGSTIEYPNWRRRLSRELVDLMDDPGTKAELAAIASARSGKIE